MRDKKKVMLPKAEANLALNIISVLGEKIKNGRGNPHTHAVYKFLGNHKDLFKSDENLVPKLTIFDSVNEDLGITFKVFYINKDIEYINTQLNRSSYRKNDVKIGIYQDQIICIEHMVDKFIDYIDALDVVIRHIMRACDNELENFIKYRNDLKNKPMMELSKQFKILLDPKPLYEEIDFKEALVVIQEILKSRDEFTILAWALSR